MSAGAAHGLLLSALLLLLAAVLPPLLIGAVAAALLDFAQARLGVREPTPPALARLLGGGLTLVLLLPWLGPELVRFSVRLLAALPLVVR